MLPEPEDYIWTIRNPDTDRENKELYERRVLEKEFCIASQVSGSDRTTLATKYEEPVFKFDLEQCHVVT